MTTKEFRQKVKTTYPNVKISIKRICFCDLARDFAYNLFIDFIDKKADATAFTIINEWAKQVNDKKILKCRGI